jgi:ribosome-associated protein
MMIEITETITLHETELRIDFVQASGPGGQNVNKVATAAQLRFDIANSPSLPGEVKTRLIRLAGKRVTQEGVLILEARNHRTQEGNRQEAIRRFVELVRRALEKPKKRKPTKPSQAAQEKRLQVKKRRGEIKRARGKGSIENE